MEIGDLSQLRYLSLNGNQLKKLPESIGNLTNLTHLSLDGNLLKKLPDSIRNLKKLKYLSIAKNLITFEEQKKIKALLPEDCQIINL